ncbi:uncharacterized protein [Anabrus simplex]|uniref:uncharacterized protein n=1 Tax=Anabrus simplex TaxID=316456 RepID=UPI0034DD84FD
MQPSAWFLLGTLLLTTVATAMLCGAIMTDHWEHVTWDRGKLEDIVARRRNTSRSHEHQSLEWLLDGQVARIVMNVELPARKRNLKTSVKRIDETLEGNQQPSVFLVPMHGGIWTLCVSLTDDQRQLLKQVGFTQRQCINYLAPEMARGEESRPDWQHRMQNLSISCALVCLIILGSSALVGAFGVLKHQISAVLVTGVMYLLAATFAMFTLTIIHFKRQQSKTNKDSSVADCLGTGKDVNNVLIDGVSPSQHSAQQMLDAEFLTARVFTTSWSLDLGWGGVTLCVLASVLWILLSKIMRYSPLSTLLA